jgi:uncharacterized membrane protein
MATAQMTIGEAAAPRGRSDSLFYPLFALAAAAAVFVGFGFTYFGPVAAGSFPQASPFVHVHGWSFFLWYLLFPLQAVLIARRGYKLHIALGRLSLVLATVMVVSGFFVLVVRVDEAMSGGDDFFLRFLRKVGPLVLSGLVLFSIFYAAAIRAALTGRMQTHKRLMLLASSAGLGAALFRIFMITWGPGWMADVGWALVTNVFMLAGAVYDRAVHGRVHPVYWSGITLALVAEALVWPFAGTPVVPAVNLALATIGQHVSYLY